MEKIRLSVEPASGIRSEAPQMLSDAFRRPYDIRQWIWKHEANPHGQSRVVVARRGDRIVGIRPMMRSPLVWNHEHVEAVQFVDSAVAEPERGGGLFRELCMKALSELKGTLVFNTPNQMSFPAYMKMGWHDVGGLVRLWKPLSAVSLLRYAAGRCRIFSRGARSGDLAEVFAGYPAVFDAPDGRIAEFLKSPENYFPNRLMIRHDPEWLKWRTASPDGTRFWFFCPNDHFMLTFYPLAADYLMGVKIMDVFVDFYHSVEVRNGILEFIRVMKKCCDFISVAASIGHPVLKFLKGRGPVRKEPIHFVVNTTNIGEDVGCRAISPGNWALMQGAFDYN